MAAIKKSVQKKGVTISFGIQKGGVGKTSTTSIIAYLLSEIHKKKVLLIDCDSQGNATFFITRKSIYDFYGKTTLEFTLKALPPHECIVKVSKNLHIIPAEDTLSDLEEYVYTDWRDSNSILYNNNRHLFILQQSIDQIKNEYDYILLDLPPNPALMTRMCLIACDYSVVLMSCDILCYEAVSRYLAIINAIIKNNFNPNMQLLGIIPTLISTRLGLHTAYLDMAREKYGNIVFDSTISNKSRIQEFAATGISNRTDSAKRVLSPYEKLTKPDKEALSQYVELTKELLNRVDAIGK